MSKPWANSELMPCPSPAAYRRHKRRGEPVDDGCRDAYNAEARLRRVNPSGRSAARIRAYRDARARAAAVEALIELHPVQFHRLHVAALRALTGQAGGS